MKSDDYITVTATFLRATPVAVQLHRGSVSPWIPRSLIHGADEFQVDELKAGDEVELRIFRWKVEESGLLGEDADQGELL